MEHWRPAAVGERLKFLQKGLRAMDVALRPAQNLAVVGKHTEVRRYQDGRKKQRPCEQNAGQIDPSAFRVRALYLWLGHSGGWDVGTGLSRFYDARGNQSTDAAS